MNFFKSILLDDPDPPKSLNSDQPGPNSPLKPPHEDANPAAAAAAQEGTAADGWSFGGLIKTLATRSESVIETYRKDLEEFGSGLKKESEIIREAASRAVKDLPASLEAGTSAAQGVLDGVLKSTAEIISKETQVFGSDGEPETPETNRSLNSGRYSWFESQVSAVQSDPSTFCEEPEDVEEYKRWKVTFDLDEKKDEIEDMVGENANLEGVYERVVPSAVDHETFWCRYFYRVDKLKQQESVRANLVKRAISADEDDDLSWDVDDDDVVVEKDGNGSKVKSGAEVKEVKSDEREVKSDEREVKSDEVGGVKSDEKEKEVKSEEVDGLKSEEKEKEVKSNEVGESKSVEKEKEEVDGLKSEEREKEVKSDVVVGGGLKSEEKMKSEEKSNENVGVVEKGESGKKGDVSEEEDLGWDEIEDIGSGDENKNSKTSDAGRVNRDELRKQLSVEDDGDEDLSWDIEDDDDDNNVPVKSKS
ncbi:hypothetical protein ABFS83_14G196700 [Erythranthe nasuta]